MNLPKNSSVCCHEFEEAYGVFIIENPLWDPDFDPTPPDDTPREHLPTAYDEPPDAARRYALNRDETYMPMTRCPFCGQSHARYSRRFRARY